MNLMAPDKHQRLLPMKNRILILFAHPLFEKSRVHKNLVKHLPEGVTFHDLYELYPEFDIDIEKEKALLLEHDIIVWQHPLYWYSCPPILKQWIDMVLEAGWAYGPGGTALKGKTILQVLSTGGAQSTYTPEGYHQYTLREFLPPFVRTAGLCNMGYLPPFVVHGSHRVTDEETAIQGKALCQILEYLGNNDFDPEAFSAFDYLNDWYQKNFNIS
jgi:glutathione-regulated potassium-efflux system ancillary protein KefG